MHVYSKIPHDHNSFIQQAGKIKQKRTHVKKDAQAKMAAMARKRSPNRDETREGAEEVGAGAGPWASTLITNFI